MIRQQGTRHAAERVRAGMGIANVHRMPGSAQGWRLVAPQGGVAGQAGQEDHAGHEAFRRQGASIRTGRAQRVKSRTARERAGAGPPAISYRRGCETRPLPLPNRPS